MNRDTNKAMIILGRSTEYASLLNAVNNGSIRVVYKTMYGDTDGSLSTYLLHLINDSDQLYRYKVFKDDKELPQGKLPKEIQDCINIPELKPLMLKHKLGISE